MTDAPKWVNVHVGYDGNDFAIDGIPVWQHKWHNTGETAMLENRPTTLASANSLFMRYAPTTS